MTPASQLCPHHAASCPGASTGSHHRRVVAGRAAPLSLKNRASALTWRPTSDKRELSRRMRASQTVLGGNPSPVTRHPSPVTCKVFALGGADMVRRRSETSRWMVSRGQRRGQLWSVRQSIRRSGDQASPLIRLWAGDEAGGRSMRHAPGRGAGPPSQLRYPWNLRFICAFCAIVPTQISPAAGRGTPRGRPGARTYPTGYMPQGWHNFRPKCHLGVASTRRSASAQTTLGRRSKLVNVSPAGLVATAQLGGLLDRRHGVQGGRRNRQELGHEQLLGAARTAYLDSL